MVRVISRIVLEKTDKGSPEERWAKIETRLARTDSKFRARFREDLEMSWIFHDSALEGSVYTFNELKTAIDPTITVIPDSSLQPICEEIRRHREAIHWVQEYASKKRQLISVDVIKKLYLILHPERGDIKAVNYREEIPQHRLYLHEYAAPDKIAPKVKQIVDWIVDPEVKRTRTTLRIASKAHYDFVRTFPFEQDSGKVGRLFMNIILLRAGFPPAIVHHAERQRYYDALKGSLSTMTQILSDSIDNALQSAERTLDEYETKTKSFVAP